MVPKPKLAPTKQTEVQIAQSEAPQLERVHWMRDAGLRRLYFWAGIICMASATTGYDGYDNEFLRSDMPIQWR